MIRLSETRDFADYNLLDHDTKSLRQYFNDLMDYKAGAGHIVYVQTHVMRKTTVEWRSFIRHNLYVSGINKRIKLWKDKGWND